jgi:hypothetical protein
LEAEIMPPPRDKLSTASTSRLKRNPNDFEVELIDDVELTQAIQFHRFHPLDSTWTGVPVVKDQIFPPSTSVTIFPSNFVPLITGRPTKVRVYLKRTEEMRRNDTRIHCTAEALYRRAGVIKSVKSNQGLQVPDNHNRDHDQSLDLIVPASDCWGAFWMTILVYSAGPASDSNEYFQFHKVKLAFQPALRPVVRVVPIRYFRVTGTTMLTPAVWPPQGLTPTSEPSSTEATGVVHEITPMMPVTVFQTALGPSFEFWEI